MKCFISMPMQGKSIEQVREEMERWKKDFGFCDSEFIDSILPEEFVKEHTPLQCLSEAIKLLSTADAVFFVPGWEESRGCRIEHEIAKSYGLAIYK